MKKSSHFVIIKHEAKRAGLHYDLRFKMPTSNMWASFAVRKGVPTSPGQKVLAVRTHDHTRDEALYTGRIKEGYGAGKLTKFDGGSCIILKYSTGHIALDFKGSKIKGVYHLVSTGVIDKDYKSKSYMLFKGKVTTEGIGFGPVNGDSEQGGGGCGMGSRVPPGDTQEVELGDEDADKQQTKPLKWDIRKSKIGGCHD